MGGCEVKFCQFTVSIHVIHAHYGTTITIVNPRFWVNPYAHFAVMLIARQMLDQSLQIQRKIQNFDSELEERY